MAAYGPQMFLGPGWPTRDGRIPWGLFWLLYAQLRKLASLERLHTTVATARAIAAAFAQDRETGQRLLEEELAHVFPGSARPAGVFQPVTETSDAE